jgi:hypothetical protein
MMVKKKSVEDRIPSQSSQRAALALILPRQTQTDFSMRSLRLPCVVLSALLHCLPLARIAPMGLAAAPAPWVAVLRLVGAAIATVGSLHAISGASVTLSNPAGGTVRATNGVPSAFRVSMTYVDGGNIISPAAYDAANLPPGFNPPSKSGSIWRITGTPTQTGVFSNVRLTGYERADKKGDHKATFNLTITVVGAPPSGPPVFARVPTNQTVHAGETVTLSAPATGTGTLTYVWQHGGQTLATATGPDLVLTEVTADAGGDYVVSVTDTGGTTNSPPAILRVVAPLTTGPVSLGSTGLRLPFNGIPGRTYALEVSSSPAAENWQRLEEMEATESSAFSIQQLDPEQQWIRVRAR